MNYRFLRIEDFCLDPFSGLVGIYEWLDVGVPAYLKSEAIRMMVEADTLSVFQGLPAASPSVRVRRLMELYEYGITINQ